LHPKPLIKVVELKIDGSSLIMNKNFILNIKQFDTKLCSSGGNKMSGFVLKKSRIIWKSTAAHTFYIFNQMIQKIKARAFPEFFIAKFTKHVCSTSFGCWLHSYFISYVELRCDLINTKGK
jgi:hypothetical protein